MTFLFTYYGLKKLFGVLLPRDMVVDLMLIFGAIARRGAIEGLSRIDAVVVNRD